MSNRTPLTKAARLPSPADAEALYFELLKWFYDKADAIRARAVAARLREVLASLPEFAQSIRGEEVRSLIAELDDDLATAIRSREAEIRKILELHSLSLNSPSWATVKRLYDFGDVSDRLDLLAILYDKSGDAARALATLLESKQYCQAHGVPFEAQDLLDELEAGQSASQVEEPATGLDVNLLDELIRKAYPNFGQPADEIVLTDRHARQFASAVNKLFPGNRTATVQDIKRRLLALRKRSSSRGGLPRLKT